MGNYTLHPYFQNMKTIGSEIDSIDSENCDLLTAVENEIRDAIKEVQAAGKPDEKVNERGEWTVLQRIHELVDDKTFVPLNSLFNPEGNKNGSKGMSMNIQEAYRTPNRLDQKRNSSRHIIIRTTNTLNKERILKAVREKVK